MARRPPVRELEALEWRVRIRAIRGVESQAEFAERTGFSVRQVKRWEKGGLPSESSSLDLAASTGYPARLFRPAPEPTLGEIKAMLEEVLSRLNGGRKR